MPNSNPNRRYTDQLAATGVWCPHPKQTPACPPPPPGRYQLTSIFIQRGVRAGQGAGGKARALGLPAQCTGLPSWVLVAKGVWGATKHALVDVVVRLGPSMTRSSSAIQMPLASCCPASTQAAKVPHGRALPGVWRPKARESAAGSWPQSSKQGDTAQGHPLDRKICTGEIDAIS